MSQPKSHFALPNKYLVTPPVKKRLHGGGCGSHPRGETKGLSQAVSDLLQSESIIPRCAEPQRQIRQRQEHFESAHQQSSMQTPRVSPPSKPWSRIEQGLRTTDLLLQGGGFSAIVFDMGSLDPEFVSRVPLATWFRYRAAAERTQSSIPLLTQHGCAKSSAELLLRLRPGRAICDEVTVFSGVEPYVGVVRRRFGEDSVKVIPLRKPPQSATAASWQCRTTWVGRR